MLTIEQQRFLKPKQTLRLTDDGYLCLTVKRLLSESEFKLDLQDFQAESSWQRAFPKGIFILALFFAGFTMATLGIAFLFSDHSLRMQLLEVTAFWLGATALSGTWFWMTRSEFIVYFNRFSGEPVVLIHTDLPNPAAVQRFVRALDARLLGIHRPARSTFAAPLIFPGMEGNDPRCSLN